MMGWFNKVMRRNTSKLIRTKVNPKVFQQQSAKKGNDEEELTEFFDTILKILEDKLATQRFLCGDSISIIDIMFYCEVVTILKLYNKEIPRDQLACVAEWFQKIGQNEALVIMDKKLAEVCDEWKLNE